MAKKLRKNKFLGNLKIESLEKICEILKKYCILAELLQKNWEKMQFNDIFIRNCRFSQRTLEYFLETQRQKHLKKYVKFWKNTWNFEKILYFSRVMAKKLRKNVFQRHFYMEVSVFYTEHWWCLLRQHTGKPHRTEIRNKIRNRIKINWIKMELIRN